MSAAINTRLIAFFFLHALNFSDLIMLSDLEIAHLFSIFIKIYKKQQNSSWVK